MPQKRHPPLPRTVQISIACFLHVDDGNVFVVVFIFYFIIIVLFCFFPSRERPSSSTCCYGFVREGENVVVVSLKNRTGISLDHSTDGRTPLSCWGPGTSQRCFAGVSQSLQYPLLQLVRWDMDLFTVSLPL